MKKSDYLVISCSLNEDSNSRKMAREAFEQLQAKADCDWVDLRDFELPMCDGGSAYGHPNVAKLTEKIRNAKCVIMAVPIYNFDVNAAAKNLIELTGKAWTDKIVGFLCAAGGKSSYMSVMGVGNSLMLDFRCLIIPKFVYADGSSFSDTEIVDEAVKARVAELATSAVRLCGQKVTI